MHVLEWDAPNIPDGSFDTVLILGVAETQCWLVSEAVAVSQKKPPSGPDSFLQAFSEPKRRALAKAKAKTKAKSKARAKVGLAAQAVPIADGCPDNLVRDLELLVDEHDAAAFEVKQIADDWHEANELHERAAEEEQQELHANDAAGSGGAPGTGMDAVCAEHPNGGDCAGVDDYSSVLEYLGLEEGSKIGARLEIRKKKGLSEAHLQIRISATSQIVSI